MTAIYCANSIECVKHIAEGKGPTRLRGRDKEFCIYCQRAGKIPDSAASVMSILERVSSTDMSEETPVQRIKMAEAGNAVDEEQMKLFRSGRHDANRSKVLWRLFSERDRHSGANRAIENIVSFCNRLSQGDRKILFAYIDEKYSNHEFFYDDMIRPLVERGTSRLEKLVAKSEKALKESKNKANLNAFGLAADEDEDGANAASLYERLAEIQLRVPVNVDMDLNNTIGSASEQLRKGPDGLVARTYEIKINPLSLGALASDEAAEKIVRHEFEHIDMNILGLQEFLADSFAKEISQLPNPSAIMRMFPLIRNMCNDVLINEKIGLGFEFFSGAPQGSRRDFPDQVGVSNKLSDLLLAGLSVGPGIETDEDGRLAISFVTRRSMEKAFPETIPIFAEAESYYGTGMLRMAGVGSEVMKKVALEITRLYISDFMNKTPRQMPFVL